MVGNLNAQLSAWGRGLEALTEGKLHPSLIDQRKLQQAVHTLEGKANAVGRRLLHEGQNAIFKLPVSYLASRDGKISIIVHIPLVDQEPMEMFEYLPMPVEVKDFYLEISAPKLILGIDSRGQKGLELSHIELLRCLTEERHNGKIFICPNANLMRNDIRSTCLGSIFFNLPKVTEKQCQHFIMKKVSEDVRQVSDHEILMFSSQSETIAEKCQHGTRFFQINTGLVKHTIQPGCEVSTKDFTFKHPTDIETTENFVRSEIVTTKFNVIEASSEKVHRAIDALRKLVVIEKINTDQIEHWISNENDETKDLVINRIMSVAAGSIGLLAAATIIFMFIKFKMSKPRNDK
jgi:hypothetical protein